jgi:hypothetical protein
MQDAYAPKIAELLTIDHPHSLDAGSPNPETGRRLLQIDPAELCAPLPVRDEAMARACLAGLWLRFDFLDESHRISQEIDTPTGSAWHAIMHRREGDFGNSKYWWRRVGKHAALIGDPFAFVDAVEAFVGRGVGDETVLLQTQQQEWQKLFDHCCRAAVGGASALKS